MSRTIVLLYPRFDSDFPHPTKRIGLPLAPLTVARPLVKAGYDVRIIDENIMPRAIDAMRECPEPLYVGISSLGGNTVNTGRKLALQAKKLWPNSPRVWGGWSPTLLTKAYEHPSARKWVDIVVRGRGEMQALEIACRLERGETNMEGIPGVSWWDDEGIVHRNPDAPFDDPTESELIPYHLIPDLEPYTTKYGIINYVASYGCPHRCEFCGIPVGTQTFKATANERVVNHLLHFVHMGMKEVVFFDDNFFTSKKRVVDLAQRLVDANVGLKWHCNGRVDQITLLDEQEMALVAKSGCASINVGYETGDQEVANDVSKDIDVDDMLALADTMKRHNIGLSVNFIVGLPGEKPESLVRSLESLIWIYQRQPNMEVSWYIFIAAAGDGAVGSIDPTGPAGQGPRDPRRARAVRQHLHGAPVPVLRTAEVAVARVARQAQGDRVVLLDGLCVADSKEPGGEVGLHAAACPLPMAVREAEVPLPLRLARGVLAAPHAVQGALGAEGPLQNPALLRHMAALAKGPPSQGPELHPCGGDSAQLLTV